MMGLVVIGSFRNGASQVANSNKELDSQCRRLKRQGFNPWVRRSPGEGHGDLLQYSSLENPWKGQLGGLWSIGLTYHVLDNQQTGAGSQQSQQGGYSVETFSPAPSAIHPTP